MRENKTKKIKDVDSYLKLLRDLNNLSIHNYRLDYFLYNDLDEILLEIEQIKHAISNFRRSLKDFKLKNNVKDS